MSRRARGIYNFREQGFPAEEAPGLSVFYKDAAGQVYHTYSTYARGGEPFIGVYQFLDLVPKGRDEDGLAFSMSWVRHHDRYDDGVSRRSVAHLRAAAGEGRLLRTRVQLRPAETVIAHASVDVLRALLDHCSPQRRTSPR